MGGAELGMVIAAAAALGGFWAAFLRPSARVRLEGSARDPLDRGSVLPEWLAPLYPVLWPVLRAVEGTRVVRGNLPERIARSGYTPYAAASAVWAARLQGMAIGVAAMVAGSLLFGMLLGTPLPGVIAGLGLGFYGLIAPDREIEEAIRERRRRFRANMLLVVATARGFLRVGRSFDDAFSRAAQGEGVFANWVRFLIARHNSVGLAALEEGRRHAPDPNDPYLVRFLDMARVAWTGGSGMDVILEGMVQDLAADMEQGISETVTTVEPLVLGAGILAIAGYVLAILMPVFFGSEAFLGF
ncbi:hypothetical protein HRbin22_01371 [Candidatus Thermoflexus japonica]|uniref:Type II secretion system protein GspF domain-containing protein n=1 Tax=Candidatus Thermoflexus japonica TaxID=2035417 RepID=A0A2H5Y6P3_9CHLR|nr:hypothetical protein HRbin22_01371 [Candidatus Thermoflexus japonica]